MNGRLWTALRIDRLSVDFTALSIAAHSCMSSPEQTRLLITMGLMPAKIRDWKLGRWNFGEIGGPPTWLWLAESGAGDTACSVIRRGTLGFDCRSHDYWSHDRRSHDCGGVVVVSGSIDSRQPLAHARGSGRGRADSVVGFQPRRCSAALRLVAPRTQTTPKPESPPIEL